MGDTRKQVLEEEIIRTIEKMDAGKLEKLHRFIAEILLERESESEGGSDG